MILGLFRWTGPTHGYDVRRELLSWDADRWANLQPGSIYHALRKMTEEGLLREVSTEQVSARPARTTYEITAKGEDEFQNLLHSAWWQVDSPIDAFLAAFTFVSELPRDEAAAALRSRAAYLRSTVDRLRASRDSDWIRQKPANVAWMFELWAAQTDAEVDWCERVADQIESGMPYAFEDRVIIKLDQ
jgi:DNA-binding PadR family transcriptional regulator